MSHSPAATANTSELFSPVELEQFEADDVTAGSAIGKMLSILFLYTVLAMSLVCWWTFSTVKARTTPSEAPAADHGGH
ncbi:MAG: hypothetical protein KDA91_03425 [Planctomycetaceae bacterium]|nr:hypothetical protein [Planctomycetaceae bacterium]